MWGGGVELIFCLVKCLVLLPCRSVWDARHGPDLEGLWLARGWGHLCPQGPFPHPKCEASPVQWVQTTGSLSESPPWL